MMQATKIRLSPEEKALVLDPGWILTKRSVMEKVGLLFGDLAERYRMTAAGAMGPLAERFPKLSRGENYRGLPYVILDYPAVFDKENVFAIRTLFWWGHYFSITLHLKGAYFDRYLPVLRNRIPVNGEWHLAVSADEWVHAVEDGAYERWSGVLTERSYFKIASVIPLDRWEEAPGWLDNRFGEMTGWLAGGGERC